MTVPAALLHGAAEIRGRMPWSSNATYLVELRCEDDPDAGASGGGEPMLAIYKPGRGERPLWDFPRGLYRREAAAWELDRLLGTALVPETIVRDGPLGEGSMQRFVVHDPEQHHFTLVEQPEHLDALRAICVFDIVANNTDRKSGHCLLDPHGRIWAIDNGLCFHPLPKLRTVIWEFAGEPVPDHLLACVERMLGALPGPLSPLLDDEEIDAVRARSEALLRRATFPYPDPGGRCWPWPLV